MAVEGERPEAAAAEANPLPRGYTAMLDILDKETPSGMCSVGGLVEDCLLPTLTRGGDYKMTLKLVDKSLEPSMSTLQIHIFKKNESDMPRVHSSDVVLVQHAKMQSRDGAMSLLSNYNSKFIVYLAKKMPPPPKSAEEALDLTQGDAQSAKLTAKDHEFASWLFHNVAHGSIPDEEEFDARAQRSLHVREKFSLLKDVRPDMFYDMIVRVEHKPYSCGGAMNIWVSDYTKHTLFVDFDKPGSASAKNGQAGDPYAYMHQYTAKTTNKLLADWKGPLGQMSMQVSCFGRNCKYVADYVEMGHWLELKNVRVRMGHNAAYLEGIMYEDTEYGCPLRVHLVQTDNIDAIDPRYKDALRRMRDHQKQCKHGPAADQKTGDAPKGGKKRKKNANSEQRRKERRAGKGKGHEQKATKDADGENAEKPPALPLALHCNDNVVSERQDEPITLLADVLAPVYWQKPAMDADAAAEKGLSLDRLPDKIRLPFVNMNFRAQVRVVDFLPARLEDFAVGRKQSELDILSDNDSDDFDSSDDENLEGCRESSILWDWRFALLLEEATPTGDKTDQGKEETPARLWAVVDNNEAQMLTGLTACDLRRNPKLVDQLRETMFVLWGNLEEKKRQQLREQREAAVAEKAAKAAKAAAKKKQQAARRGQAAPADSSDDEWQQTQNKRSLPSQNKKSKNDSNNNNSGSQQVSNRPFVCCMRQYGVRRRTAQADDDDDDDSAKTEWKQTFGLFGTKIRNLSGLEDGGEEENGDVVDLA